MKVFIQGDREAKGCEESARALAQEFARQGIEVNLGAYGQLVAIFLEAKCPAVCHGHRANDRGQCPDTVEFIDFSVPGNPEVVNQDSAKIYAWTGRLDHLIEGSEAAVFFPGREGTLAHLMPFLAFAKRQSKKVALVGWSTEMVKALDTLGCNGFVSFSSDEPSAVAKFLTQSC